MTPLGRAKRLAPAEFLIDIYRILIYDNYTDIRYNWGRCAPWRKKLDTLTEPMYYVLLSLVEERHGYGVMQYASQLTGGRVAIGAGTLYALLDRFERDGLIIRTRLEDNRKYYRLTADGRKVLEEEFDRLRRQVADGECVLKGRRMP